MSLPRRDYRGRNASVSMMELRSQPGEVIDSVAHGMSIRVEKNGKHVATIVPPEADGDTTEIMPDGSIHGPMPLTFRCELGTGGYD